jgi:hypothetical protein
MNLQMHESLSSRASVLRVTLLMAAVFSTTSCGPSPPPPPNQSVNAQTQVKYFGQGNFSGSGWYLTVTGQGFSKQAK